MITSRAQVCVALERTIARHLKVVEEINNGIKDRECRATLKHYREEIEALRMVHEWIVNAPDPVTPDGHKA